MQTRTAAHLSVGFTFFFLLLSFSFGFHNYTNAKQRIVSELNCALQETLSRQAQNWISQDSIRAYNRLAAVYGNPIIIDSYNQGFSDILQRFASDRKSGIRVQVYNPNVPSASMPKMEDTEYLTSDTILWASALPVLSTGKEDEVAISLAFQGYADYTCWDILLLMNKVQPLTCLMVAALTFFLFIYLQRRRSSNLSWSIEQPATSGNIIFGNLTLVTAESNFYIDNDERLKLTPLQSSLLELFFQAPNHILNRTEICETLWPGKVNADETLNTLVRRLRPILELNTNLKITTDRGKAYILEIGRLEQSANT